MPTVSPKQYGFMQARAHGKLRSAAGPSPEVAREFINKTSAKKRSQFAKALRKK